MDNRTARVEFAERVQAVRRDAGLTEEQLAERTGIAYRTLRRRMSYPGGFSIDELAAIAEAVVPPTATADEREAAAKACFTFLLSGHRAVLEAVSA